MRYLILSLLAVFITNSAAAQDLSWGPKIGMTQSSISEANNTKDDLLDDKSTGNLGLRGGFFARVSFPGFYIQPEAMFHHSRVSLKNVEDVNEVDINYNKVNVPVMAGKRFLKVIRFNAGPVFSFHLSDNVDIDEDKNMNFKYNDLTVGLQGGIGFDIWKIVLDARYQWNISKLTNNIKYDGTEFDTQLKSNFFLFEIGYRFN
ncbi:MAG: hypothetical protein BRD49_01960 [Bacteroidetes bacterium SW_10_40_5]|nr:MAG: hypothetical protein BRD49_01960 [Bacteroidetes bacterium SW_10_40_5]